jgi:hypothetical protein
MTIDHRTRLEEAIFGAPGSDGSTFSVVLFAGPRGRRDRAAHCTVASASARREAGVPSRGW